MPWSAARAPTSARSAAPGWRCRPDSASRRGRFWAFLAEDTRVTAWLAELDALAPADLEGARRLGAAMRQHLAARPVPAAIREVLAAAWRAAGPEHAYAVRSSATAEDLPEASFAGQYDTYLNVRGEAALVDRVRACWASLYTDRAILYRLENGIAAREVALSVVVQRMVRAEKSGHSLYRGSGDGPPLHHRDRRRLRARRGARLGPDLARSLQGGRPRRPARRGADRRQGDRHSARRFGRHGCARRFPMLVVPRAS